MVKNVAWTTMDVSIEHKIIFILNRIIIIYFYIYSIFP